MRCIAFERGHDGVAIREAREEFDVPDDRIGKDGKPKDGSTWFAAKGKGKAEPEVAPEPIRPPGAGPATPDAQ